MCRFTVNAFLLRSRFTLCFISQYLLTGQYPRNTSNQDLQKIEIQIAVKLHELGSGSVVQNSLHTVATSVTAGAKRLWLSSTDVVAEVDTPFTMVSG